MRDNIYVGLVHYPVYNRNSDVVATSVTNFDIHDISRTCRTYDIKKYFIITPVDAQQELTNRIINYWTEGDGIEFNKNRKEAFENTDLSDSVEAAVAAIAEVEGKKPKIITTSAKIFPNTVSYDLLGKEMTEDEKAIASDNAESDTTEGSYEKELTQIAKKSVEFAVQFSPSRQVKKHIAKYVEPAFITAKMQKPKIESVEKVCSGAGGKTASVIKIKGDGLKLVGEGATLYIKTGDGLIKISKEAVLQNEPKTLMVLVNAPLKDGEKYSLGIATKYAKMGNRQTSVIRRCVKEFKFEKLDRKLGTLKAKLKAKKIS